MTYVLVLVHGPEVGDPWSLQPSIFYGELHWWWVWVWFPDLKEENDKWFFNGNLCEIRSWAREGSPLVLSPTVFHAHSLSLSLPSVMKQEVFAASLAQHKSVPCSEIRDSQRHIYGIRRHRTAYVVQKHGRGGRTYGYTCLRNEWPCSGT